MVPKKNTKEDPPKVVFRMSTRNTARGNDEPAPQDPPADTDPPPAEEGTDDSEESNEQEKKSDGKKKSASPKKRKSASPEQPTRTSARLATNQPAAPQATPDVGLSASEFQNRVWSIIASSTPKSQVQGQTANMSDLESRVRHLRSQFPWKGVQPTVPAATPDAKSAEPTNESSEQTGEKRKAKKSTDEDNIYDVTSSSDDEGPPKKKTRMPTEKQQEEAKRSQERSRKWKEAKEAEEKQLAETAEKQKQDNGGVDNTTKSKKKSPKKKTPKKGKANQTEAVQGVTNVAGGRILQRNLTSTAQPQAGVPDHLRSQLPAPAATGYGFSRPYQSPYPPLLPPAPASAAGFPPARTGASRASGPASLLRTNPDGSAYIFNPNNQPQQDQNLYYTEAQRNAVEGQQRQQHQQQQPPPPTQQGQGNTQFGGINFVPLPPVVARASTRALLFEALASNDPHRLALEQKKRADELSEVLLQRNLKMESAGSSVVLEIPGVDVLLQDMEDIRRRLAEVEQRERTQTFPQGIPSPEPGEVVQPPVQQDQDNMAMDMDDNEESSQPVRPADLHIDPALFGVVGPDPTPYEDLTAEQYRSLPRHQPQFPPDHRARVRHLPPMPPRQRVSAQQQQRNSGNSGGDSDTEMGGINDWRPWEGMSNDQANRAFGQLTHPDVPQEAEQYTYPPPVNDMIPGPESMLEIWTSGPHWNIDQNRDLLQEMRDEEEQEEVQAQPAARRSRPRKKAAPKKKATPKKKK